MIQVINTGNIPNDNTGDSVRVGAQKINANFKYLDEKTSAYVVGEIYKGPVVRVYNEKLYTLKSTNTFPFTATNFATELAAGNWVLVNTEVDLTLKADLVDGKVPASQLPSYVDDVIEVASFSALPTTGETGKIYVTLDTNKQYRWGGTGYIELSNGSAVWGSIGGTITNQTDLMNLLNAKQNTISATANRLLRFTPGGIVNSIIHDNGTNVGIGTLNPEVRLHVAGSGIFDDGINGRLTLQFDSSQNDIFSTTTGFNDWKNLRFSAKELIFSTDGTNERMRITSTGNVGIGTSSPDASAILHLRSSSKGFLPPVMSGGERDNISSAALGLIIYNTSSDTLDVFTSNGWRQITGL